MVSSSTHVDVLLVDDRMVDADMTLFALQRVAPHLRVLTLNSGSETLEYLFSVGDFAGFPPGKPRLVLLDAEMPVMSGFSVLDLMRAHPTTRNVPVVMLISSPAPGMLKRNERFAADTYIAKPLDLAMYSAVLERSLRRWIPELSRRPSKRCDQDHAYLPMSFRCDAQMRTL